MKITYYEADDILHIEFSTEPIVRDVSHSWYVNLEYSATGLAGITILDARAGGFWPIEDVRRRMTEEGLSDVTVGRLVSKDAARRWSDSIGTDSELPARHRLTPQEEIRQQEHIREFRGRLLNWQGDLDALRSSLRDLLLARELPLGPDAQFPDIDDGARTR